MEDLGQQSQGDLEPRAASPSGAWTPAPLAEAPRAAEPAMLGASQLDAALEFPS